MMENHLPRQNNPRMWSELLPSRRQIFRSSLLFWFLVTYLSTCLLTSATEIDLFTDKDHNHHRLLDDLADGNTVFSEAGSIAVAYQAEFEGVDRSIIGRADDGPTNLQNNVPTVGTVSPGQTTNFVFQIPNSGTGAGLDIPSSPPGSGLAKRGVQVLDISNESGEVEVQHASLRKRQNSGGQIVYISVTMCSAKSTDQLTLYVSQTQQNPGPGQPQDQTLSIPLVQGYANMTLDGNGNAYIGVSAPPADASEEWSFVIGASVDNFVSEFNSTTPFAFLIDTDSNSALLSTFNLTDPNAPDDNLRQEWQSLSGNAPFSMFIFDGSTSLDGFQNSFCGLAQKQIPNPNITTSISTRNKGQNPKQDFYVQDLQPGTTYQAVLAFNGTIHSPDSGMYTLGGGKVFQSFTFTTKSDGNCQIIYGLPFCSDVAYAVPSNSNSKMSQLVEFYDNGAEQYWQNFTNSLQQVACNTTDTAQYSPVKNCNDCKNDYKTWLCAATIPRCQDLSESPISNAYTIPRNIAANFLNGSTPNLTEYNLPNNATEISWYKSSRNPSIDSEIEPGPYRELLPCQDICYQIVRSCPAIMGFQCPVIKQAGLFNRSYGVFDISTAVHTKQWTCNYLGIDPPTTSSAIQLTGWGSLATFILVGHLILYVL